MARWQLGGVAVDAEVSGCSLERFRPIEHILSKTREQKTSCELENAIYRSIYRNWFLDWDTTFLPIARRKRGNEVTIAKRPEKRGVKCCTHTAGSRSTATLRVRSIGYVQRMQEWESPVQSLPLAQGGQTTAAATKVATPKQLANRYIHASRTIQKCRESIRSPRRSWGC